MSFLDLFLWPEAAALFFFIPVAWIVFGIFDHRRRAKVLDRLGPRHRALLGGDVFSHRLRRRLLFAGAGVFGILALMQPRWGRSAERIEQRGIDIMVVLDVSQSMLAQDLEPNRLERAKGEIRKLAESLKGDRLGLVVFAGQAKLWIPMTEDVDSFQGLLTMADPLSVMEGGTDIGAALNLALERLGPTEGDHEAILVLTDGEDLEGRGLEISKRCAERGVSVHCVGLGTPLGAKIPVWMEDQEVFLQDASGQDVITTLDAPSLQRMARAAGGEFLRASSVEDPLLALYEKRLRPMARKAMEVRERETMKNRYQWPLFLALLLWSLETTLVNRMRREALAS